MLLSNCEILTSSTNCVISEGDKQATLTKTDSKLYVPGVTFSTQDNKRADFKRTIDWSKYQSKVSIEKQDSYLNFQVNPNFQGETDFLFIISK